MNLKSMVFRVLGFVIFVAFIGCGDSNKSTFEELILPTIKQNMDYEQTSTYYKDLCDKGEVRACALLIDYMSDFGDMERNLRFMREALKRYWHIASLYEKPCLDTESSESKQACEIMAYASHKVWVAIYDVGVAILNSESIDDINPQKIAQIFSQRLGDVSIPQLQDLQKPIHKACDNEALRPCLYDMVIPMRSSVVFGDRLIDDTKVSVMRDKILQLAQSRLKADSSDLIALGVLQDLYQLLGSYYFDIKYGYVPSATLDTQEAAKLHQESKAMALQYAERLCKAGVQYGCKLKE